MGDSSRSVGHTPGCSASPGLCKPCLTQGGHHHHDDGTTSAELAPPKRHIRVSFICVPDRISAIKTQEESTWP
jgi:hypothetical protein